MRADLSLVEQGLCPSRAQAQSLIEQGLVFVRKGIAPPVLVKKASQRIEVFETLELARNSDPQFVSRGGVKLHHALMHLELNVSGFRCMDFGQSTGGFTDCLLKSGAASVIGLDVGKDQLHASLKDDPRVFAMEGVNLKTVDVDGLKLTLREGRSEFLPIAFAVADLSFISLSKVMPTFSKLLVQGCKVLCLVKPQFEVGQAHIGKQGLVKGLDDLLQELESNIRASCELNSFEVHDFFPCAIKGGDGNQEYWVFATKGEDRH